MEVEILHSLDGDKKKTLDRSTPECRLEVQKFIKRQLKDGVALFLERGEGKNLKTYRVTGYDPKKDKLKVRLDKHVPAIPAANRCQRGFVAGNIRVPGLVGREVNASPDKGRTTAVPPRAGG